MPWWLYKQEMAWWLYKQEIPWRLYNKKCHGDYTTRNATVTIQQGMPWWLYKQEMAWWLYKQEIKWWLYNKKCHGDYTTRNATVTIQPPALLFNYRNILKGGTAEATVFKTVRYGPWDITPAQIVTNQDNIILTILILSCHLRLISKMGYFRHNEYTFKHLINQQTKYSVYKGKLNDLYTMKRGTAFKQPF